MRRRLKDRHSRIVPPALLVVLLAAACPVMPADQCSVLGGQCESGDHGPASALLIPRFISGPALNSGIAVFNPSENEASATFILKDADGDFLVDKTVIVPPYGQVAKTADQLFPGLDGVDGSVLAVADTSGLMVYSLIYDGSMTAVDGSPAAELSNRLLFPVVPNASEGTSEISIHNPNPRPAAVDLSLWSLGGMILGRATVRIPAGGMYHGHPENIFPSGTSFSEASHITAVSRPFNIFSQAQSISGSTAFSGFSSAPAPDGSLDFGILNAEPLDRLTKSGVIPHFRAGPQDASTLSLANVESAAVNVTITAVGDDGSTLGTTMVSVPARGGLRASIQALFPSREFEDVEGWILIESSGRLDAMILFGKSDGAALSAVPLQPAPMLETIFPHVLHGSGNSMDIAMVNPGPLTAYAGIYVVHASGATLASNQIVLPPGSRVNKSLSQLMPEISAVAGGYLFIEATEPIFSTASVWIGGDAGVFNLIPQPLAAPYEPPELSSYAVTGFVTLDGVPAEGLRIVLSGPVRRMATSGPDGSYVFTGVPPGVYSMGIDPSMSGYFSAQISFEISSASVRQDFQVYSDPGGF